MIKELETLFTQTTSEKPRHTVAVHSQNRLSFLEKIQHLHFESYLPPKSLERTLWGIRFRTPLFNAAGLFKNGEGYNFIARIGAGAYLGGTAVTNPRKGNERDDIHLPFTTYPQSHAMSCWLGLNGEGDTAIAQRLRTIQKIEGCPLGMSVSPSPDLNGEKALKALVHGMNLYEQAGVDFLEINWQCPNTPNGKPAINELHHSWEYVAHHFLKIRRRNLPVIAKLSVDTNPTDIPNIIDTLLNLGYDGFNPGNSSTNYQQFRETISPAERERYDYFTQTFCGSLSGRGLKKTAHTLATIATEHLQKQTPTHEFHILRTGGIETAEDLHASDTANISINQWMTGFIEKLHHDGTEVYKKIYNEYLV